MNYKGWITILIGVYSLTGLFVAKKLIYGYTIGQQGINVLPINIFELLLFGLALIVILISILTIYIIHRKKSVPISKVKNLYFFLPFSLGMILLFIVANKGYYQLATPILLLTYGLALLILQRVSKSNLLFLGVSEILLGVISLFLIHYHLLILAIGFGLLHFAQGIYYWKNKDLA